LLRPADQGPAAMTGGAAALPVVPFDELDRLLDELERL
jgi:hypothetical protein